ncbi:hypothetical protein BDU57DRAFT_87242 [Ampelomyces quisqualis]|uniref:Uncharacterized protein n=1 Tax=Ampelomyces quisqualis TaxID=50730 RepID=A0A6A5QAG9_AMPQU|nr:hypothetical protein BDU57DRAFT_87242 [Ampelomyces quisqualis]
MHRCICMCVLLTHTAKRNPNHPATHIPRPAFSACTLCPSPPSLPLSPWGPKNRVKSGVPTLRGRSALSRHVFICCTDVRWKSRSGWLAVGCAGLLVVAVVWVSCSVEGKAVLEHVGFVVWMCFEETGWLEVVGGWSFVRMVVVKGRECVEG